MPIWLLLVGVTRVATGITNMAALGLSPLGWCCHPKTAICPIFVVLNKPFRLFPSGFIKPRLGKCLQVDDFYNLNIQCTC